MPFAEFNPSDYSIPIERQETVQRVISRMKSQIAFSWKVSPYVHKLLDTSRHVRNLFEGCVILEGDELNRFGSMEALIRPKRWASWLNFERHALEAHHIRGEASMPLRPLDAVTVAIGLGKSDQTRLSMRCGSIALPNPPYNR